MAGETPRAARYRQKRIDRTIVRSADEYYKSTDTSTHDPEAVKTVKKDGRPPRAKSTDHTIVRSSDEYYANQDAVKPVAGTPRPRLIAALPDTGAWHIASREAIPGFMRELSERCQRQEEIALTIEAPPLIHVMLRAALDSLVTRGLMDEEQRRGVRVAPRREAPPDEETTVSAPIPGVPVAPSSLPWFAVPTVAALPAAKALPPVAPPEDDSDSDLDISSFVKK